MAVSPVLPRLYLLKAGYPWSVPVIGRLLRKRLMRRPGHMRVLQSPIFYLDGRRPSPACEGTRGLALQCGAHPWCMPFAEAQAPAVCMPVLSSSVLDRMKERSIGPGSAGCAVQQTLGSKGCEKCYIACAGAHCSGDGVSQGCLYLSLVSSLVLLPYLVCSTSATLRHTKITISFPSASCIFAGHCEGLYITFYCTHVTFIYKNVPCYAHRRNQACAGS